MPETLLNMGHSREQSRQESAFTELEFPSEWETRTPVIYTVCRGHARVKENLKQGRRKGMKGAFRFQVRGSGKASPSR